jgi:transcriptional regulator with XRE-family HTH domain
MMGEELRRARERAGLTQEQLSFRAGLSRPYVSQLERNLKSPTVATLFLICDALDVSAADVVSRVGHRPKPQNPNLTLCRERFREDLPSSWRPGAHRDPLPRCARLVRGVGTWSA